MRLLCAMLVAGLATPAAAQDHAGHDMSGMSMDEPAQAECEESDAGHHAMGHSAPAAACPSDEQTPEPDPGAPAMDHSHMHHGDTMMEMAPIPAGPPPAEAGSGPPRAADAIWGADAMAASRAALRRENGGQTFARLLVDRLEYRAREGRDGYLWEGQAWIGGDLDRLSIKSEGEGSFGGEAEQAEVQALWSHAIGPWLDLNTGVRHDFTDPARTHLVLGVQGLAPYEFEFDGSLFLSDEGDLTARVEAELDQRITQRLIVQPRAELELAAQDSPELGIGAGLDRAELGVRLRYEFAREFAPYVGIAQEWRVGKSADFARARGEDVATTSLVMGIRFWF